MKKPGFHAVMQVYLAVMCGLIVLAGLAAGIATSLLTVRRSDGSVVKSDWPKVFTERFSGYIECAQGTARVAPRGVELLEQYGLGIQILNEDGKQVFHFRAPEGKPEAYTGAQLLRLTDGGDEQGVALTGTLERADCEYIYILYFPFPLSKVTMYLNAEAFRDGKSVALVLIAAAGIAVAVWGIGYGYWMTRALRRMSASVYAVAARSYRPAPAKGMFADVYASLTLLDAEMKESDAQREQTERMREEWITNITHDLRTPLSTIKGYAELLADGASTQEAERYAGFMCRNASHMEALIDDLKLTYQLKNGMLPCDRRTRDLVRFTRDLIIDLLNHPDYQSRSVDFESEPAQIDFAFDGTLLTRAITNLVVNAFVHGERDTQVAVRVADRAECIEITISDDGRGMDAEAMRRLFERYYRGADTAKAPSGTGLGLAIAKQIVELHGGDLSAQSELGRGTTFCIRFIKVKDN